MKKIIIQLVAVGTILSAVSFTVRRSSSGAPASHTGAPEEQTCAVSGCHDDNKINSGTARLHILVGEDLSAVEPGKTYPIKIRISDEQVNRFGFQLVALEPKSGKAQGHFQIVDSARTQIVENDKRLKEREYVTYTFSGTDAVRTGLGEWTVNWTAPTEPGRGVTFYAAAVSANDDASDKGDKVYTTSLTLKSNR